MFLSDLELKNVRNYRLLRLDFSPQVNIFFGQNAQGKTNLLEAIALLSLGRSFRTNQDSDVIAWETEACYLAGTYQTEAGATRLELGISHHEKRLKLDGRSVKPGTTFGAFPVVAFAPDDLQLVKGGPQHRRDFIDLYLAQLEPQYRFISYNYHKVLQQRNRFLKEGGRDLTALEAWDEQLVAKGTKVIKYRAQLIAGVAPLVSQAHTAISGAQEELHLEYRRLNDREFASDDEGAIGAAFREELHQARPSEMERRISLVGPQRDDLQLTIGKQIELRSFGSQGQQRTAALALKLGVAERLRQLKGEYPLLLLDDVLSEFDDARKQALLQLLVNSAQTFITTTNRQKFWDGERETALFQVEQGEVRANG